MGYKRISPQVVSEGGTGAMTLTGLVVGNGTSALTALPLTSGQVVIGGTGSPAAATLTQGANITITNGNNSITIAAAGGVVTIDGDSGSVTGSTITLTGGTSGAVFTGSSTTLTESFNFLALPNTNSGGSVGYISFGGTPYLSNFGTDNIFLGLGSGNFTSTSSGSVGIGYHTLAAQTNATGNVAIGFAALPAATSSGSNVAIGVGSLEFVTTGSGFNTAIGSDTLGNSGFTTGAYNVALGYNAGSSLATGTESSNILIAHNGVTADNHTIRIGTQGSSTAQQNICYIAGIVGVTTSNTQMVTINSSTGQLGAAAIPTTAFNSIVVQTFTTPGTATYTPTSGMQYCTIEVMGGGGGGGGSTTTGAGNLSGGGGGGGGGYARKTVTAAVIGGSQTVTIGAAGTAGNAGGGNGGTGGTSSVGSIVSATGGGGGSGVGAGPSWGAPAVAGGVGSSGDINAAGATSGPGYGVFAIGINLNGPGANSMWGSGGPNQEGGAGSVAGNAGSGYGAGGSGAYSYQNATQQPGGAGSQGIVIITEYVH